MFYWCIPYNHYDVIRPYLFMTFFISMWLYSLVNMMSETTEPLYVSLEIYHEQRFDTLTFIGKVCDCCP